MKFGGEIFGGCVVCLVNKFYFEFFYIFYSGIVCLMLFKECYYSYKKYLLFDMYNE